MRPELSEGGLGDRNEPSRRVPSPSLQGIPSENTHRIFSFLTLERAGCCARASSSLWDAFVSLPKEADLFRRAMLARLGLSVRVSTSAGLQDAEISWRDELRETSSLIAKLRAKGPIDGRLQKYLRWCDRTSTGSPRVIHGLVGISLLPHNIEDLFVASSGEPTEDVQHILRFLFGGMSTAGRLERVLLLARDGEEPPSLAWYQSFKPSAALARLDSLWEACEDPQQGDGLANLHDHIPEPEGAPVLAEDCQAATRHFDVRRFRELVRWFVDGAPEGLSEWNREYAPKNYPDIMLRTMMAEFEQIQVRGWGVLPRATLRLVHLEELRRRGEMSTYGSAQERQLGAFLVLHQLSLCDPEQSVKCWA